MPLSKPLNLSNENTVLAEQFFSQVSESIQLVFDLTSRIDERVKMLIEKQNELDAKMTRFSESVQLISNRLTILESKDYPSLKEDLSKIRENIAAISLTGEDVEDLEDKVHNLEVKLEMISLKLGTHDNRWFLMFDTVWKMALMLVAGYILYKLGLQAPPVP